MSDAHLGEFAALCAGDPYNGKAGIIDGGNNGVYIIDNRVHLPDGLHGSHAPYVLPTA